MVLFGVLGPITIHHEGGELAPTAPKLRLVLATLLARTNEIVSCDDLIEELWGQRVPRTALTTLYVYVSHLRKLLAALPDRNGDTGRLVTSSLGYSLLTSPKEFDVQTFESLSEEGRDALVANRPDQAAALLRAALAVWRGPAMADVASAAGPTLGLAIARLEESRMAVLEHRLEADLQLGRHAELIGELQTLVARHPLRENLRGKYMIALYRAGRQYDALATYRELRRNVVEELGLDPGPQLQAVHQAILAADADRADAGIPVLRPVQQPRGSVPERRPRLRSGTMPVPVKVADFTGRAAQMDAIKDLVRRTCSGSDANVVLVSVAGLPGVGKTALAVQLMYELENDFPDGRCWVRAREPDDAPADPLAVQRMILGALGVESERMPNTVHEFCELLRAETTGRRLLVVLDDVHCEAQVRPLLAMTPGCAVVTTSRRVPAGIEGLRTVTLGPLARYHGVELLGRIVGPDRLAAEPQAAEGLVDSCGGLPLAIRIAGSRLAVKTHWKIRTLADRLGGDRPSLSELRAGDADVLSVFDQDYSDCDEAVLAAFGLLGLLPAGPFGLEDARVVLRTGREAAFDLLEQMIDEQLVQSLPGDPGDPRFRLHPLLRSYALELASRKAGMDENGTAAPNRCGWAETCDVQ
ncbi:MAG TPA: BTAD domain-containing putative transcriptional regulator [Actinocrinis sp.]